EILYAGTQLGVYIKIGIANWEEYNLAFPKVRIGELEIYYDANVNNNKLRAATYGRGLWEVDLYSPVTTPQAPIAKFGADKTSLCSGDTVTFIDSTLNSPTSWSWTFSPSSITYVNSTNNTSQNPVVVFANSGQYSVSLTATNSLGSNTKTVNNYISVGGLEPPFMEDFETTSTTLADWSVTNPDNLTTWGLAATSGNGSSARSVTMQYYSNNHAGQRDNLISPTLNLSSFNSASLQYNHAYTRYSSTSTDSLIIYISNNCGSSWTRLASFGENGTGNFATAPDNTYAASGSFSPSTSSDWCGSAIGASCDSIDISAYAGSANVKIAFQGYDNYGNNLYIDNIQVIGVNTSNVIADFDLPTSGICTGTSATFNNTSQNATTYQWKIDNIDISTSQHLTYNFSSIGIKEVRLV
ncbi:MAG: PKD domain-containing protein, partial [Chlamydiia bacterium]|nr:PKD domain-containing protein [Chlamydiia bacterium]